MINEERGLERLPARSFLKLFFGGGYALLDFQKTRSQPDGKPCPDLF
jgi:hypothetical protein